MITICEPNMAVMSFLYKRKIDFHACFDRSTQKCIVNKAYKITIENSV